MLSFSGVKSSAHRLVSKMSPEEIELNRKDLCASYQEAIVDVLIKKTLLAAKRFNSTKIVITGGVSANSRLREKAQAMAAKNKFQLVIPPLRYCTDNAAMIGYAGLLRLQRGESSTLAMGPSSQLLEDDFKFDLQ